MVASLVAICGSERGDYITGARCAMASGDADLRGGSHRAKLSAVIGCTSLHVIPSYAGVSFPRKNRVAAGSLNHLIRPLQERLWDREPEGFGGLEVDHELELRGLLDGK